MKEAILFREKSTEQGTFGYFACDGRFWHSLELPDKNNKKSLSCIPCGEYICKTRYSPKFKREIYNLKNVEGRTYILIHSANFAGDIEKGWQSHLNGCIALGKKRGIFKNKYGKNQRAILNSKMAEKEMMSFMENEDFKLTIEEL